MLRPWTGLLSLVLSLMLLPAWGQSDIENVIVETYYIADANDATDVTCGGLVEGSRTYRIYIDLCSECALRAVYGDTAHVLEIASTALIFDHLDRGKTFGHEINNGALDENVLALDSWLAMGAASNQRAGVLKADDPDGSFIGGVQNDGGSAEVPGGLLINADAAAGEPLTARDGLMPLATSIALPPNFNVAGDDPTRAWKDSTLVSVFRSWDFRMGCATPGVKGPTDANQVLVAQVTTAGELSFHLNIEVEHVDGSVAKYVASDSALAEGETANGLLNYPPICGCTDPDFLEYDPSAGCDDGSCATAIRFGCLDTIACNYDASANFHIQQLCCYGPANCNGLDPALACPELGIATQRLAEARVFPDPFREEFYVDLAAVASEGVSWQLRDVFGREVVNGSGSAGTKRLRIEQPQLASGVYFLSLASGRDRHVFTVIKE